jgi:hypothetical protein
MPRLARYYDSDDDSSDGDNSDEENDSSEESEIEELRTHRAGLSNKLQQNSESVLEK